MLIPLPHAKPRSTPPPFSTGSTPAGARGFLLGGDQPGWLAPRSSAPLLQCSPAPPSPHFPLLPLPSSAWPLTLKASAGGPALNSHTNKTLSLWVGTTKEINSAMVKPLRLRKQLPGNLNPSNSGRIQIKRGGARPTHTILKRPTKQVFEFPGYNTRTPTHPT